MSGDLDGAARALDAISMNDDKIESDEVALELGEVRKAIIDHECVPVPPELDRERAIELVAGAIGRGAHAEDLAIQVVNVLRDHQVRLVAPRGRL